jgi:radical SAM superfamily enzyme YgiQ (UPF0313 family)
MNVLLLNPASGQTYWSMNRVLRMLGKHAMDPPLGLITVAALLPADWQFRLVELAARQLSQADWDFCDVVMISGMGVQYSGIMESVKEARRHGKRVVVGGPAASHAPEDVLEAGADIVVKGEAELVIPQLLAALGSGTSGVVLQSEALPDLRESPVPRFDLLDMDSYANMDVQFSRGCPFNCEFCDITVMFGRKVRTKSPAQILAELQTLYDLGWRRYVLVVDDNFIGAPARARALLSAMIPWMRERGYPFDLTTQASVNLAFDRGLLDSMVAAGFFQVFLGIETPDAESLARAHKQQNAAVDLDLVCQTITRAGLQIIAGCIIGFDDERRGADERLIAFAERNNIALTFVTLLQVGPGSDLFSRLEREGRLDDYRPTANVGGQTNLINFAPPGRCPNWSRSSFTSIRTCTSRPRT